MKQSIGNLVCGLALLGTVASAAAQNLVANGDFTANAAAFVNSPGYVGGGNPTISEWIDIGTYLGLNGDGTGVGSPFAPGSFTGTFAFLQGPGMELDQALALAPNTTYSLSFEAASRAGYPTGTFAVDVVDGASTLVTSGNLLGDQSGFDLYTYSFTTPATLTAPTIQLLNNSGSGDVTVDFANVMVQEVPEPATMALAGLGGLALFWQLRRRN